MNLGAQLGPMSITKLSPNWACQMGPVHCPKFVLPGFELSTVTSQSHHQSHSWTGKVVPALGTILMCPLKTDLTLFQQFAWFKIRFSTYYMYSLSEEICLVCVCCCSRSFVLSSRFFLPFHVALFLFP